MSRTLLIVEDNYALARALRESLRREGYRPVVCPDVESARQFAEEEALDLVLLDLGLPDADGMALLRELQEGMPSLPVMIVTARDALDDRVAGLDGGAVDYLVKPVEIPELLARIRAVFRVNRPGASVLQCGDLSFDPIRGEAFWPEGKLTLSPLEVRLLRYLLEYQNRIVSRSMLATDVWEIRSRSTPMDNVIEAAISRLREKLQPAGAPAILHTVRGIGYLLKEPDPS